MQGYVEANRLGGVEVDDKLELVRRLHRQVCGAAALEKAIHIGRGAAVLVVEIDPVGCKSPLGDKPSASFCLLPPNWLKQGTIETFFDSMSNHFNRLATSARTNFCRLARTCYDILRKGGADAFPSRSPS
jgi:hypothetical protein